MHGEDAAISESLSYTHKTGQIRTEKWVSRVQRKKEALREDAKEGLWEELKYLQDKGTFVLLSLFLFG